MTVIADHHHHHVSSSRQLEYNGKPFLHGVSFFSIFLPIGLIIVRQTFEHDTMQQQQQQNCILL